MINIGQKVYIDSIEGFGGEAVVIDKRDCQFSKYKVRILETNMEFWAYDQEIECLPVKNANT